MHYYWSYPTLFLYIAIAFLAIYGLTLEKKRHLKITLGNSISISAGYFLFFISFWLLAVVRCTEDGYGGIDIANYLRTFDNIKSVKISIFSLLSSEQNEPLFLLITKAIGFISQNHRFYLAVMYGIIVIGYITFIKTYCSYRVSLIPMIMLIFPFLKSFCTLRSSVAIAIILIGLCVYNKNKIWGWVIVSLFIHISAALYIPFPAFYELYKKKKEKLSTVKIIFMAVFYITLVYVLATIFKRNFGASVFTGNYSYYANTLNGNSFISRIPLYFMQLALAAALVITNKKSNNIECIYEDNESTSEAQEKEFFVKLCCIYDIIVIPAAFLFGIWRANEFFYIARLLMWGKIMEPFKTNRNMKYLVNALAFSVVMIWLIFRLSHEFAELGIMPYAV